MTALEENHLRRERSQSRDSMKIRLISALDSVKQIFGSMSTSNSRTGSTYQHNSIFASQDYLNTTSHATTYHKMTDIKDDIYQPSKSPPKSIASISPDREEFSTNLDEIQENLFSESSKQLFKREKFQRDRGVKGKVLRSDDSSREDMTASQSSDESSQSGVSGLWKTKESNIHIFTNPWCDHNNINDIWNNNQRKKTREHPPNLRSILHHTHRQDTEDSSTCEHETASIAPARGKDTSCSQGTRSCVLVDQGTMTESWMDQYSSDSELDDEELTCRICDRAFETPKELHKHKAKKRHWGCDFCGDIFNSEIELEYHKEDEGHWSDDEYDDDDQDDFVTSCTDAEHVYGIYSEDSQSTDSNLLIY